MKVAASAAVKKAINVQIVAVKEVDLADIAGDHYHGDDRHREVVQGPLILDHRNVAAIVVAISIPSLDLLNVTRNAVSTSSSVNLLQNPKRRANRVITTRSRTRMIAKSAVKKDRSLPMGKKLLVQPLRKHLSLHLQPIKVLNAAPNLALVKMRHHLHKRPKFDYFDSLGAAALSNYVLIFTTVFKILNIEHN